MGAFSAGINDAMGMGGPYTPRPDLGPGVGFGVGLPQPGEQNPMDILGGGLNSAFGGTGVMGLGNTAGQAVNAAFGGLANGIQGNQPAPNTLPTVGMSGKGIGSLMGGALGGGGQLLNQIGLPQVGNAVGQLGGVAQQMFPNQQQPITQGNGQLPPGFGAPSPIDRSQIGNAQIGFGPAPVNRFAPPNAPGVRMPPRAGVPVQQARQVTPNQYTRTRAPRTR